ncbi:MAG: flagellar export protein FliJ [Treponemataceae bacterium]
MKTFRFRLEKILQLRSFYEEQAKIELGRCNREVEKIKNVLKQIASEKVLTRRAMGFNDFNLQDFLASETYLKNLDAKKEIFLERLVTAELKVEKARKEFIAASQKRKILTKLKEKQALQWKKERQQEEDAILDDIVNSKTVRERFL